MKNFSASAYDRLLNISRAEKKNFQLLLTRYFHERLLYRLSISRFCNHFCLKGGVLLYALQTEKNRPTLDLDLLGMNIRNDHAQMSMVFKELCSIPFERDGVLFDASEIATSNIAKELKYPGIRLKFAASLGNARQIMQIDVGFGDQLVFHPFLMSFPTLLDMAAPEIHAYAVEQVIAEKFHTMISLGETNSRMKDFYDLFHLLRPGRFEPETLQAAISETFKNRQTELFQEHPLFSIAFGENAVRHNQWNAFLQKSHLETLDFTEVHRHISQGLESYFRLLF